MKCNSTEFILIWYFWSHPPGGFLSENLDDLIPESSKLQRMKKQIKVYSRAQLLNDVKDLLDVFCGLLPHLIGLLATHVCRAAASPHRAAGAKTKRSRVNSTKADSGLNALIQAHHPDSFIIIIIQSFRITEQSWESVCRPCCSDCLQPDTQMTQTLIWEMWRCCRVRRRAWDWEII